MTKGRARRQELQCALLTEAGIIVERSRSRVRKYTRNQGRAVMIWRPERG